MKPSSYLEEYVKSIKNNNGKIGIFSVGHYIYWDQWTLKNINKKKFVDGKDNRVMLGRK